MVCFIPGRWQHYHCGVSLCSEIRGWGERLYRLPNTA